MFSTPEKFAAVLKDCCDSLHNAVYAQIVTAEETTTQVLVYVLMISEDRYRWVAQFVMEKHEKWQIDAIHIKLVDRIGKPEIET